jgi:penicillin-binding protein 2
MYIEKEKITPREIKNLSLVFKLILVTIFIALFFMLWKIQIVGYDHYTSLAIRNIHKTIDIKAPRGLIVDRNHQVLVENQINFSLFLIRENMVNESKTLKFASMITGHTEDELLGRINKYKKYPKFYLIPLTRNLPLQKVIFIESRSEEYPEFKIDIEPTRACPHRDLAAHILGYVSEITTLELSQLKGEGYRLGDEIGKSGVEKQYEGFLKGTRGEQIVIKDNQGRIHEVIDEANPLIGGKVVLTIDLELQAFVKKLMGEHHGSIGIADLKSGSILALVNNPSYNPEFFAGPFNQQEWLKLVNDPAKPLHNKFIQGEYSPGSIYKIVISLAALQEKIITPSTRILCTGSTRIYDRNFHCWVAGGHGFMDLTNALKNSCNVFFYQTGKRLDVDRIAYFANALGLGQKTGIDLPNENAGLIPTRAWKEETLKQKWFPGETISIAIGQGMMNVTPAQMLLMISTVALRGQMPTLHLLSKISRQGKIIKEFHPSFKQVPIEQGYFERVVEGLFRVVNDGGTGRSAHLKGLDICGKTGTAQIIAKDNPKYRQLVKQKRFKPHSWFVSFAPKVNPEIAMVVFIEHGGDGGVVAAPMARKIYDHYFSGKKTK